MAREERVQVRSQGIININQQEEEDPQEKLRWGTGEAGGETVWDSIPPPSIPSRTPSSVPSSTEKPFSHDSLLETQLEALPLFSDYPR